MGSSERRQREREQMRQLICRAAMKLFLADGFGKVSIRRIAEEIEYTAGALYSYFKDKDEILHTLHEQGFRLLNDRFEAIDTTLPPFERLQQMGLCYLRFALEHREFYELMFIDGATIERALQAKDWQPGRCAYDLLRQQTKLCMSVGALPEHELEAATLSLWATVHGLASLVIKRRLVMVPAEHLEAMVRSAFDFSLKGMQATPA